MWMVHEKPRFQTKNKYFQHCYVVFFLHTSYGVSWFFCTKREKDFMQHANGISVGSVISETPEPTFLFIFFENVKYGIPYDKFWTYFWATATFIIFWDFLMFWQIFLPPQVKRRAIITYKHGIYKLPHKLSNELRLRTLAN